MFDTYRMIKVRQSLNQTSQNNEWSVAKQIPTAEVPFAPIVIWPLEENVHTKTWSNVVD